ncbi:MAG TPA: hypothetical protein VGK73_33965 [Polyangiaceae bacterium]
MTFSLNGHACISGRVDIPGVGLWYASVDLAGEVELEGAVTLTVLDTTWSGFVIAGGPVDGRSRYRLVAGAGGWGRDLPSRAYANDAGLPLARILADAATEAGEPAPASPPATILGPHYVRPVQPAAFVLNALAPRGWYARADGVVELATRPAGPFPKAPVVERNPAARVIELALTDSATDVLPGIQTEYGPVSDAELEFGADGVRARLYAAPTPGRRAQAYARIVAASDPGARFRGVFEYRIVSQVGDRLNLQPVRTRASMPDLARVPVRMGVPGVRAQHALGSQVLVVFLDADPSRPVVLGFDSPEQPGWHPLFLELGGPGPLGVARQTDPVIAGGFAGTITLGSTRIKAGP